MITTTSILQVFIVITFSLLSVHGQTQTFQIENCMFEYNKVCYMCAASYILAQNNKSCFTSGNTINQNEKCMKYDSLKNCQECHCGYGLGTDRQCRDNSQWIQNCSAYDSQNLCIRCKNHVNFQIEGMTYALSADRKQCIDNSKFVPFCYQYNLDQQTCLRCIDEYQYDTNLQKCLQQTIKFCNNEVKNAISNTAQCFQCIIKYLPTTDRKNCFPLMENCLFLQSINQCDVCALGYILNPSTFKCIQNDYTDCIEYSFIPFLRCKKCVQGLMLQKDGTCFKSTQYSLHLCEQFTGDSQCGQCASGYVATWNGKFCLESKISGCLKLSINEKFCSNCDSQAGYVVLTQENAKESESNCFKPNNQNLLNCRVAYNEFLCKFCQQGFFQGKDSFCYDIEKSNCLQGNSDRDCWYCSPKYIVVGGVCQIRDQEVDELAFPDQKKILEDPNCFETDLKFSMCLVCESLFDFNKVEKKCFRNVQAVENSGVLKFDPLDKQALTCTKGYSLLFDYCINNFRLDVCQIDKFKLTQETIKSLQTGYLTCAACLPGFSFDEGCNRLPHQGCTRVLCTNPCLQTNLTQDFAYYNQIDSCIDNSYFPFLVRQCLIYKSNLNECSQCKPNYLAVRNDKNLITSCIPQIMNCISFNQNSPDCKICETGYVLSFDSTQCYAEVPNLVGCTRALDSNRCQICQDNTDDGKDFGYDTDLQKCFDQNLLSGAIKNCYQFESSSGTPLCTLCQDGYIDNNGNCDLRPQYSNINCLTQSYKVYENVEYFSCLSCPKGYFLKDYACHKIIPDCMQYDETNIYCNACQIGMIVSSSRLQCENYLPPYSNFLQCVEYNKNECIQCSFGYFLSPNKTCLIKDPYCSQPDTFACQQCIDGFTFSQNGSCFRKIDNCQTYDQVGRCQQCLDGASKRNDSLQCSFKQAHQNCLKYADDLGCIDGNCINGYSIQNPEASTICELSIDQCESLDIDGSCNKCTDPSQIPNSVRIKCITPKIANCQDYLTDDVCTQCKPGFIIAEDYQTCIEEIPGCAEYISNGICKQCDIQYSIPSTTSKSGNVECVPGVNDGSSENPFFCQKYEQFENGRYMVCKQCATGLVLTENKSQCVFLAHHCKGPFCLIYQSFSGYDSERNCFENSEISEAEVNNMITDSGTIDIIDSSAISSSTTTVNSATSAINSDSNNTSVAPIVSQSSSLQENILKPFLLLITLAVYVLNL